MEKKFSFKNLDNAVSFSGRMLKANAVILGENDEFWVVNLRQMEKLLKQGYELAY